MKRLNLLPLRSSQCSSACRPGGCSAQSIQEWSGQKAPSACQSGSQHPQCTSSLPCQLNQAVIATHTTQHPAPASCNFNMGQVLRGPASTGRVINKGNLQSIKNNASTHTNMPSQQLHCYKTGHINNNNNKDNLKGNSFYYIPKVGSAHTSLCKIPKNIHVI